MSQRQALVVPFKVNSIDEIDMDAYSRAVVRLEHVFVHFSPKTIQNIKDRFLSVEITSQDRVKHIIKFKINKDPKFDHYTRAGHRGVTFNRGVRFCSCFFSPWMKTKIRKQCSHIGACLLLVYYLQELSYDVSST